MNENRRSILRDEPFTLPPEIGIHISFDKNRIMVYAEIDEMEGIYHQILAENIGWADETKILEEP